MRSSCEAETEEQDDGIGWCGTFTLGSTDSEGLDDGIGGRRTFGLESADSQELDDSVFSFGGHRTF